MNRGFTVIETMITLIIAGIFLIGGYQLFAAVDARNSEIRRLSVASNIAYGNLRERAQYPTGSLPVCGSETDHRMSVPVASGVALPEPVRSWLDYCKVPGSGLIRVVSVTTYGRDAGYGEAQHATYISR